MRLDSSTAQAYLARFDGYSDEACLGTLAGLQLLPENSKAILRLESAVEILCKRSRDQAGTQSPTPYRVRSWLGSSPFGWAEDPLNNPFTAAITFFDGSYTVFPGPVENALFTLRQLLRGLFTRGEVPDPALWTDTVNLTLAALRLSTEIAERADLGRATAPVFRSEPPCHRAFGWPTWSEPSNSRAGSWM